jgi:uncharacterized protein (TIGR03000 family)
MDRGILTPRRQVSRIEILAGRFDRLRWWIEAAPRRETSQRLPLSSREGAMKAISRWSLAALVLVLAALPSLRGQDKDKEKPKNPKAATLVVKVVSDAKVTVDDTVTTQTGAERRFNTPELEPGVKYYYMVSATWEPNNYTTITRTRKAIVQAGKTTTVDLRKEDPKLPDKIVIRYVPTPPEVVDAMLELGKVTKDDVVYDLGCGDGRIVVSAVKKFGAKKGVGIDLDPERIKESNENAKTAGVEDKVEFRKGDVMKVKDLDKATVVCLYLADELNEQLRPILQKVLKPGTRIVSHRFLMGDWKPEKTKKVTTDTDTYRIHLWTIKGDKEGEGKKDKGKDKGKE